MNGTSVGVSFFGGEGGTHSSGAVNAPAFFLNGNSWKWRVTHFWVSNRRSFFSLNPSMGTALETTYFALFPALQLRLSFP